MTGKNSVKKYEFIFFIILILGVLFSIFFNNILYNYNFSSGDSYRIYLNVQNNENSGSFQVIEYIIFNKITNLSSQITIQFISLLVYIIISIFIFEILKNSKKRMGGIIASILFILNPWILNYSQDAEKAIFIVLFSFVIIISLKLNKFNEYFFLLLSIVILGYHTSGILVLTGLLIFYLVYSFKFNKLNILKISLFITIIFLLFLPIMHQRSNFDNKLFDTSLKTELGDKNQIVRTVQGFYNGFLMDKLGFDSIMLGLSRYLYGIDINYFILSLIFCIGLTILFCCKSIPKEIKFIIILLILSLLFFCISFDSSSHKTRYPLYIIPFLFMVFGFLVNTPLLLFKKKIIFIIIFIVIVTVINSAFNITEPIKITKSSNNFYEIAMNNFSINPDLNKKILIPAWPAIEYSINKLGVNDSEIIRYGWGEVNLSKLSEEEYINKNNITYFVYLNPTEDYYDSSSILLEELNKKNKLKEIYSYTYFSRELIIYKIN